MDAGDHSRPAAAPTGTGPDPHAYTHRCGDGRADLLRPGPGTEWIGAQSLTSYVAGSRFERPIAAGDVVDIAARVIHTRARGVLVVVALDEQGNARPVPSWDPCSDEDRRLDAHPLDLPIAV